MKKYYYTIGEVSNLLGVKPYIIRYWETEFPGLNAIKSEGRIRKYNEQQVLLLRRIYDLLYNQRYTIEGARKIIKQERTKIQTKTKEKLDDSLSSAKKDSKMKTEITEILQDIKKDLTLIQQTCKNYNQDKK
ncbi:MerR family transcriptional regulator [Candidatus Cloacimonas acidaminovorans]|jgi:DNA-binding transcriptional MerR regulator|uniref:Transcriptional Regulator, MerR family n=1 Tax=Cloacimonas acidaminovorans (strain Evry) TaxID=459349 RepID=B0VFH1_CLOAI|nr:MerR family transcriptional regulator [Candidatus Cloacimonas acidaminovorans]CAO80223.1 Transcriptional Regulator, MerR family [Candidatus Cloacimonas acidaminovorans str. Evry]HNZ89177.1 MerR family transcriptional regulator [Candidatus Cloacimonas acidaminovorans]HOI01699.1 MerR family transcriptional regulator [Candidatus Cloacimonas acidaminovorans]HPV00007.1 MerR family transcriptional regulator [Candidatus Cloacimonas acidaminovorans]